MPATIDYQQLTQLIEKLHAKKVTGTLFLHTEDNKSCMLVFRIGVVIGVTFDHLRGKGAIQELRNNKVFSYRFQEGKPPPVRQDLDSPEDTLRALGVDVEATPESLEETMIMTSIPDLLKQVEVKRPATKAAKPPKAEEKPAAPAEAAAASEKPDAQEGALTQRLKRLFRRG